MKKVEEFLDTKISVLKLDLRVSDILFFYIILVLALVIRFMFFDIVSGDYYMFVSNWMEECHRAGGIGYLGITPLMSYDSTINYGYMYQYIIIILHYIGGWVRDMYLVKTVSVIFDIVCAVTVMRITYNVTKGDTGRALISFAVALFVPFAVLNSAAWAQCDSIYAAFALLSFLHFLKNNERRAFIYFALSFTFKLQAIFLLPFILIMWFKGKIRIRYALWVPVVILITAVPAMIAGREITELLTVYTRQAGLYTELTKNYPNIYTVFLYDLPEDVNGAIRAAGVLTALFAMAVLAYVTVRKKFEITGKYMVMLAVFSAEVCLFILPVMHERYGYIPEILAVTYAMLGRRRSISCILLWLTSLITYVDFLFGTAISSPVFPAVIMLVFIIFTGNDLYKNMRENSPEAQK